MAQLFNSRNVWQGPVREAAEDARKQADLVDEARRLGLTPEAEPYDSCFDVIVRGRVEEIVALAKWAKEREVEINEITVTYEEDLELAQRELGNTVGVADL